MDWMSVTISSFSLQSEDKLQDFDMEDMQEFCNAITSKKTDLLETAQKFDTSFHNSTADCESGSRAHIPSPLLVCSLKSSVRLNQQEMQI